MKVLHVAETMRGGVASYINDLLITNIESKEKYEMMVLSRADHISDLSSNDFFNLKNISFFSFRNSRSRILSSMFMLFTCVYLTFKIKPDIVHLHSTFAGFFLRLPLRFLFPTLNIVYCPHGWGFEREKGVVINKCVLFVEFVLSFFSDYIVCISKHEYLSALSRKFSSEKLVLIRNGISSEMLETGALNEIFWPSGKIRVLFVGRFDYQKGIDVFFKAMKLSPNAFAYVIGDSVLGDTSQPFDIPDNCKLLGWLHRSSIHKYYSSADVLVMPSRWEGFGLTAVEAMRSSLAVIATNVGGLPEIVIDGKTGFLVAPNDCKSIASLLNNNNQSIFTKLGIEGRAIFEKNFSMTRVFKELDLIYKRNKL